MNKIIKICIGIMVVVVVVSVTITIINFKKNTLGVQPNLHPRVLSTATTTVGIQQNKTLFTAKTCASRVISTVGQGIMLDFNGGTPTGSFGLWQGASTTVAYDAEQYGCGAVTVYGQVSSTTITAVELIF